MQATLNNIQKGDYVYYHPFKNAFIPSLITDVSSSCVQIKVYMSGDKNKRFSTILDNVLLSDIELIT